MGQIIFKDFLSKWPLKKLGQIDPRGSARRGLKEKISKCLPPLTKLSYIVSKLEVFVLILIDVIMKTSETNWNYLSSKK
jgi:hypothetical protein